MARNTTSDEEAGVAFTPEQLAASAYRAGFYAAQGEPLAWGLMSTAEQAGWLAVGREAATVLNNLDGKPYREAAKELFKIYQSGRPLKASDPADPHWPIVWEAVARHLTAVLDEDEIDDLPALEQSWREWAKKRLEK